MIVNLPHSLPPSGRASRAARRGAIQNSPKMQWNVRSWKKSLLKASASMVIIWRTADGMVNMLESKRENPMRRRVRVR